MGDLATDASEAIATRFISGIEAAFEALRHFPLGRPSRGYLAPGLRVTFYKSYAVYYIAPPGSVVIVRVIHGARDVEAIAGQGGFE